MTLLRLLMVLLVLALLQGCKEQVLYSKLNEQEANEMVALLFASGLPASKVAEKGGGFRVDTEVDAFAAAMTVLQSEGLPRKRFTNLGDVFAKEGFVSTPLEERARLNFALSEELAHTLSSIDGVLEARVHLAVPEKEPLADHQGPSSAAVFIKHRSDIDLAGSVGKIKALIVDGVENLPYENVTVGLFAAVAPVLSPHRIEPPYDEVLKAGIAVPRNVIKYGAATLLLFGLVFLLLGRAAVRRKLFGHQSLAKVDRDC